MATCAFLDLNQRPDITEITRMKKEKEELDKKIKEAEEENKRKISELVKKFRESLTEEQVNFLLSLIRHSCSSCSDDNPCNGYSYYKENYRCEKCMAIEFFNGEHDDFIPSFDITFLKI